MANNGHNHNGNGNGNGKNWKPIGGGGLPAPFNYSVTKDGKLAMTQNDKIIATQSENGSWFAKHIQTGLASFLLGSYYHIGAGGRKLVVTDKITENNMVFAGQDVSKDGKTADFISGIKWGDLIESYPFGSAYDTVASIPFSYTLSQPENIVAFGNGFVCKENYKGLCSLTVTDVGSGIDIAYFEKTLVLKTGNLYKNLYFDYPLFVVKDRALKVEIKKADGTILQVAKSSSSNNPYLVSHRRTVSYDHLYSIEDGIRGGLFRLQNIVDLIKHPNTQSTDCVFSESKLFMLMIKELDEYNNAVVPYISFGMTIIDGSVNVKVIVASVASKDGNLLKIKRIIDAGEYKQGREDKLIPIDWCTQYVPNSDAEILAIHIEPKTKNTKYCPLVNNASLYDKFLKTLPLSSIYLGQEIDVSSGIDDGLRFPCITINKLELGSGINGTIRSEWNNIRGAKTGELYLAEENVIKMANVDTKCPPWLNDYSFIIPPPNKPFTRYFEGTSGWGSCYYQRFKVDDSNILLNGFGATFKKVTGKFNIKMSLFESIDNAAFGKLKCIYVFNENLIEIEDSEYFIFEFSPIKLDITKTYYIGFYTSIPLSFPKYQFNQGEDYTYNGYHFLTDAVDSFKYRETKEAPAYWKVNEIIDAFQGHELNEMLSIFPNFTTKNTFYDFYINAYSKTYIINTIGLIDEKIVTINDKISILKANGDGTKYLADNGIYKNVEDVGWDKKLDLRKENISITLDDPTVISEVGESLNMRNIEAKSLDFGDAPVLENNTEFNCEAYRFSKNGNGKLLFSMVLPNQCKTKKVKVRFTFAGDKNKGFDTNEGVCYLANNNGTVSYSEYKVQVEAPDPTVYIITFEFTDSMTWENFVIGGKFFDAVLWDVSISYMSGLSTIDMFESARINQRLIDKVSNTKDGLMAFDMKHKVDCLIVNGTGDKVLCNNGLYKEIQGGGTGWNRILDLNNNENIDLLVKEQGDVNKLKINNMKCQPAVNAQFYSPSVQPVYNNTTGKFEIIRVTNDDCKMGSTSSYFALKFQTPADIGNIASCDVVIDYTKKENSVIELPNISITTTAWDYAAFEKIVITDTEIILKNVTGLKSGDTSMYAAGLNLICHSRCKIENIDIDRIVFVYQNIIKDVKMFTQRNINGVIDYELNGEIIPENIKNKRIETEALYFNSTARVVFANNKFDFQKLFGGTWSSVGSIG